MPAIQACRKRGWNVEGPLPADTLFCRTQRGDLDLVLAMYHDQDRGPVKVLDLEAVQLAPKWTPGSVAFQ